MVTDDERREVAGYIRQIDCSGFTAHSMDDGDGRSLLCAYIAEAAGVGHAPYYFDAKPLCDRLADLIEPDRDLTCELEPTASERTDAPVRVYECDCCGRSCDSVYAEDYVYCPYCGRLNTAREVEVDDEAA